MNVYPLDTMKQWELSCMMIRVETNVEFILSSTNDRTTSDVLLVVSFTIVQPAKCSTAMRRFFPYLKTQESGPAKSIQNVTNRPVIRILRMIRYFKIGFDFWHPIQLLINADTSDPIVVRLDRPGTSRWVVPESQRPIWTRNISRMGFRLLKPRDNFQTQYASLKSGNIWLRNDFPIRFVDFPIAW